MGLTILRRLHTPQYTTHQTSCFPHVLQGHFLGGTEKKCPSESAWFKKGSGTLAETAGHRLKVGRVLRTTVPDSFLNHAPNQRVREWLRPLPYPLMAICQRKAPRATSKSASAGTYTTAEFSRKLTAVNRLLRSGKSRWTRIALTAAPPAGRDCRTCAGPSRATSKQEMPRSHHCVFSWSTPTATATSAPPRSGRF